MKKVLLSLILVLTLILSACSSNSPASDEPIIRVDITPVEGSGSSVASCTAQSAAVVELAQPGDWVTGPEDYSVTLIEYGDFQ